MAPAGFPHSEIPGSRCVCHSPGLIAACRVLRRLPVPRHPPCALHIFPRISGAGAVNFSRKYCTDAWVSHTAGASRPLAVRCFSLIFTCRYRRLIFALIENRSDQMLNLDPCSLCGSQGTRVRAPGTGRCGLLAGRTGRTGFPIIRAAYSSWVLFLEDDSP